MNFPLLSDFNEETSQAYGALYEEFGFGMRGVSKRAAFVIDGAGKIRYAEVLENAGKLPDLAAVRHTLRQITNNEAATDELETQDKLISQSILLSTNVITYVLRSD